MPEQAGRLTELLDGLGLRHVALAGHSNGGYVATALAVQRPDLDDVAWPDGGDSWGHIQSTFAGQPAQDEFGGSDELEEHNKIKK